jgi:hypothetical protein
LIRVNKSHAYWLREHGDIWLKRGCTVIASCYRLLPPEPLLLEPPLLREPDEDDERLPEYDDPELLVGELL